ncbi:MAG TPA: DUF4214 domain-containing protein [Gemmataceae bacterium]|nr:DUF4214 domain-containing protein [Gemmataceae bacterium]
MPTTIVDFNIPTAQSLPLSITAGPDGNLWFTEQAANQIGRITTNGTITEFAVPTPKSQLEHITAGPDGALWFTESGSNRIGRITTDGAVTEFAIATANSSPMAIVTGSDGNLWFTETAANQIGRITPAGLITEFAIPTKDSLPGGITAGPDGNLWFTEGGALKIGRITTAGNITEFAVPAAFSPYDVIVPGPDGDLWYLTAHGPVPISVSGVVPPNVSAVGGLGFNDYVNDLAPGPDGNLWLTDFATIGPVSALREVTPQGNMLEVQGIAGKIASGPDGNLWLADAGTNQIHKLVLSSVPPPAQPPVITVTARAQIPPRVNGVIATFSEPGQNLTSSQFTAEINWGDGTTSAGIVGGAGAFYVLGSHQYASGVHGGQFTISVSIHNSLTGGTGTATAPLVDTIDTGNVPFIELAYLDLLHREPDPVGMLVWSRLLQQGVSRTDFTRALENSPEYRTNLINQFYEQYLQRNADSQGLQTWLAFLSHGGTSFALQAGILGAPEYVAAHGGGGASLLQAFYHAILNRDLDAAGAQGWAQALAAGRSPAAVAQAILQSSENETNLVGSYYRQFLHRDADSSSLTSFVTAMQHGLSPDDAVVLVVGSTEYFNAIR